jgi:hypothetical protein
MLPCDANTDYGTFRLYSSDTTAEGLAVRLRMYAIDFVKFQVSMRGRALLTVLLML